MNPKKRFIAGALCPSCKQPDKIMMYSKDNCQYRECVDCGFEDEIRIQPQYRELTTRVNQTEASKQTDVMPVKILEPKQ